MIVLNLNNKDDDYEGSRKFNIVNNSDGTISLEDKTDYKELGTEITASVLNKLNASVMGFATTTTEFVDENTIIERDAFGARKETIFSHKNGKLTVTETVYDRHDNALATKETTISDDKIEEVASV